MDGKGKPGIYSGTAQFLAINNFGYIDENGNVISSIHGFDGQNGAVVNMLNGILSVNNSVFADNSANLPDSNIIYGGAIIFNSG